jgi:hypothetical protein
MFDQPGGKRWSRMLASMHACRFCILTITISIVDTLRRALAYSIVQDKGRGRGPDGKTPSPSPAPSDGRLLSGLLTRVARFVPTDQDFNPRLCGNCAPT